MGPIAPITMDTTTMPTTLPDTEITSDPETITVIAGGPGGVSLPQTRTTIMDHRITITDTRAATTPATTIQATGTDKEPTCDRVSPPQPMPRPRAMATETTPDMRATTTPITTTDEGPIDQVSPPRPMLRPQDMATETTLDTRVTTTLAITTAKQPTRNPALRLRPPPHPRWPLAAGRVDTASTPSVRDSASAVPMRENQPMRGR